MQIKKNQNQNQKRPNQQQNKKHTSLTAFKPIQTCYNYINNFL